MTVSDDRTVGLSIEIDIDEERRRIHQAIVGGRRGKDSPFTLLNDEGKLVGPFGLMVRFPLVGSPLQELGTAIRYRTSLTPRGREIAILTVARVTTSPFEAYAHRLVALRCGLSENDVEALLAGRFYTDNTYEAGICRLSEHLLLNSAASQVEYGLDEETVAEVVTLVGYYRLLAQLMSQFNIGVPSESDHSAPEELV